MLDILNFESIGPKNTENETQRWNSVKFSALIQRREVQRSRRAEGIRIAQADLAFLNDPLVIQENETGRNSKAVPQSKCDRAAHLKSLPTTFNHAHKTITRPERAGPLVGKTFEPQGQPSHNRSQGLSKKRSRPEYPLTGLYLVRDYYSAQAAKWKKKYSRTPTAPNEMAKHRRGSDEASGKNEEYDSDGGFVEDAPKTKKAKSSVSSNKNAARSDSKDEQYWEVRCESNALSLGVRRLTLRTSSIPPRKELQYPTSRARPSSTYEITMRRMAS